MVAALRMVFEYLGNALNEKTILEACHLQSPPLKAYHAILGIHNLGYTPVVSYQVPLDIRPPSMPQDVTTTELAAFDTTVANARHPGDFRQAFAALEFSFVSNRPCIVIVQEDISAGPEDDLHAWVICRSDSAGVLYHDPRNPQLTEAAGELGDPSRFIPAPKWYLRWAWGRVRYLSLEILSNTPG